MNWVVGNGIDEYLNDLKALENSHATGKAIYEGAKIVADAVRGGIQSLPVQEHSKGTMVRGVTSAQKKGLVEGFGISRLEEDGSYRNVKLGFDGYNETKTQKYPKGQPTAMVARFVESGNSYHQKTPFIGPAVNKTKSQAEQKMAQVVDKEIQQIFK